MSNKKVRVRFAPSPTGELHLGSARTALINFLFARHNDGDFILRIEDTDQTRYVEGAMDRFFEDLHWLGLDWDEGPDKPGEVGPYIQSQRTEKYQEAAKQLIKDGHAYRCWCTPERLQEMREQQMKNKQAPRYDRHCLNLTPQEIAENEGKPYVVRLKIPDGKVVFEDLVRGEIIVNNKEIDDQVLLKSDGFPTYHLAVVVDDHAMGITHVFRSEEWLPSTPKHLLLYKAFGWEPPKFGHLPLVLNNQKRKLSKRLDGESVWAATYRKDGYLPEALVNYLVLLGWNPGNDEEFFTLDELTEKFTIERVHSAGAVFDQDKLHHFNFHYLKKYSDDEVAELLSHYHILHELIVPLSHEDLLKWIHINRERIEILSDLPRLANPILDISDYPAEKLIFRKSTKETILTGLSAAIKALSELSDESWQDSDQIQAILAKVVETNQLTNGDVFWPVRVALSGLDASPSPVELLWVLGKQKSLSRLEKALEKLK